MEYFNFTYAVDSKETGSAYPQAEFKNPKKLDPNPFLLANMAICGTYPPDNLLPFDYLELKRGAKLTDLMSSSFGGNGFLMSAKLREIFENSCIKDYKFYDVILFNKDKEIKDYYYFHSASNLSEFIDVEKSKFYIGDILRNYIRDLEFTPRNIEDLNKYKKTLPFGEEKIAVEYFYLKSSFPFDLDLFQINEFNYDFFINNRLKDKLEKAKVTGLKILPINNFIRTPNLA